jgi:hypothetical protein
MWVERTVTCSTLREFSGAESGDRSGGEHLDAIDERVSAGHSSGQ